MIVDTYCNIDNNFVAGLNELMSLTKQDLSAIKGIVQVETRKVIKDELVGVNKKIDKVDKKLVKLFNFLDKSYLKVEAEVQVIQKHLHLPVSEF